MAIDDVVSDYVISTGNNAFATIQPASGDEWLVTHVLFPTNGSCGMAPHTTDTYWSPGLFGGNSTSGTLDWDHLGGRTVQFFVTNSEYIRMSNQSGGTLTLGFSAIKTKD